GDLVVFYYAGRVGTAAPPAGAPAETGPERQLLPIDANLGNVAATGWSLERALDRLVLDSRGRCQVACLLAPSIGGRAPGTGPAAPAAGEPPAGAGPSGRDWLARLARWPGVTAWLASDRPA